MAVIDATAVRDQQRFVWDHVSAGWWRWRRLFESAAGTVTARLIELAAIGPGDVVLDIGSGVGEPAISVTRAAGPTGRVVGVDLSPAMVAGARRAAAGLPTVEFVTGDLETATLPVEVFDTAVSRWGLMFAADRVDLLRAVARRLRPGGVLAAAVWGPPPEVPAISLAFRAIGEHLALPPPPPGPGPFTMSDPDAATAELRHAGFDDVTVDDVVVPFRFESQDDFVRFSRDVLPPGMNQRIEADCGSVDDAGVWRAVADAADRFADGDGGVHLPSQALCLRGTAGR